MSRKSLMAIIEMVNTMQVIVDYMNEYLTEPGKHWPKYWFEQRVYSRWAANEILERIMEHPSTPPDEVVFDFMHEMSIYASTVNNKEKRFLFLTAKETAEDILSLFP